MNLNAELGWALARAAGVGLLALATAFLLRGVLSNASKNFARIAWTLLLVPFLTPALLVGYAYSNFSLSLIHHPSWNAAFYAVLLWLKLTPVAATILYFAPSAMSAQAYHCYRIWRANASDRSSTLRRFNAFTFWLRGPARAGIVAFTVVFLFAFSDFELASLMNVKTWTVTVFSAQTGGFALSQTLVLAAIPLATQIMLLLAIVGLLAKSRALGHNAVSRRLTTPLQWSMWVYLLATLIVVSVIPIFILLRSTFGGIGVVMESVITNDDVRATLVKQILTSCYFGIGAALCACGVAVWLSRALQPEAKPMIRATAFLATALGLLGSLLLALTLVTLFQLSGLRALYDTPLPLFIALTLVLLPFSVLLRLLVERIRASSGLHLAKLLRGSSPLRTGARRLIWELNTRRQFALFFLLFCCGYFDLTASALLAPSGASTVFVGLHNLAHYGQSAALSARMFAAFVAPVLLFLAAMLARRLFWRLSFHE